MTFAQLMALYGRTPVYQSPAGDEENSGGGGDEGKPSDEKPKGEQVSEGEAKLLKEVMKKKEKIDALSSQNEALTTSVSEVQEQLKKFEGVDPKVFKELLDERKSRKEKELEGQEDWTALKTQLLSNFESEKAQMVEQHSAKIGEVQSEYDKKIAEYESNLGKSNSLIEGLTIGTSFANSNFISERLVPSPQKVQKLYGDHFDVTDGKVQGFDKPRNSENRQLLVDEAGKPLAFEMALIKIVNSDTDKDTILRAPVKQGVDSDTKNGQGSDNKTPVTGMGRIKNSLDAAGNNS